MGYVKRKIRYLLTGARIPSSWWGVAAFASGYYSRCAAGLLKWPNIAFGTRAMVVIDPAPRNSFMPRATPATVFCPSSRVPGGYIVYHQGKLREVVNLQISSMTAEEVSVVKATMSYHGPPFTLLPPPTVEDWDLGRQTITCGGS